MKINSFKHLIMKNVKEMSIIKPGPSYQYGFFVWRAGICLDCIGSEELYLFGRYDFGKLGRGKYRWGVYVGLGWGGDGEVLRLKMNEWNG